MQFKTRGSLFTGIKQVLVSVAAFSCMMWIFAGCAGAQGKKDFSASIGFLAKEQSLGESYAVILKEFGKEDMRNYAEGIRLYANAKAEYDGLIEQLKSDLKGGQEVDSSSKFQSKLKTAADQRVAFTSFVTEKVIRNDPNRKNPVAIAAIAAVPQLVDALIKVSKSIWQEYQSVNEGQKKEILDQLDKLKWKSFQDTGKGN